MSQSDYSFERCLHDRQNPYVMISKEMLCDLSISPKAKGILCYLLSLPPNWKIYHSQLQKALNVGEDYINSAINELIDNGYAERTREKIDGKFQTYRYIIREFKKSLPDRENQTGFPGPENPELIKKERINKEKETTTAAAVSLEKKEKEQMKKHTEIYKCLESIDISETEKKWITETYSNDIVKLALKWATSPQTKITTTLVQAIKWACKNPPEIPISEEDLINHNKKQAAKILRKWMVPKTLSIECLSKYVEFAFLTSQKASICISFSNKNFINELEKTLKQTGCDYAY